MNYWLFKTEPDEFSIQDLATRPEKKEAWNGVRNYQARNFLRDEVAIDDQVFIYHSSCKKVGIAGLARVSDVGLVDPLQFDQTSAYFDAKSSRKNPRWYMIEVEHMETFDQILPLGSIKNMPDITEIALVKKGQRLSIMPVTTTEFALLLERARA